MPNFRRYAGRLVVLLAMLTIAIPTTYAQQRGKASYYSKRANGARTSSGVRFNNDSLFCAHRSHPFGTQLLVRNPINRKEVVVKVVDRGPFVRGRVIDISYEAAKRLGILSAGVAMVEVSVYDDTQIPYKPKKYELPELDLKLPATPDENETKSEWQKYKDEKVSDKQKNYPEAIKERQKEVQNHSVEKEKEEAEPQHKPAEHKKEVLEDKDKTQKKEKKATVNEGIHRRRTGANT